MPFQKSDIIRAALETLYFSRLYKAFPAGWSGMGAIFTMHHIRAQKDTFPGFHPNSCLETTPDFLIAVLERLRAQGIEFVTLSEAVQRIRQGEDAKRFAAFTIDDGYRDNLEKALPIFERFDCPFTVFIATKIVDGDAELWWLALEEIVATNDSVTACVRGEQTTYSCATAADKTAAYNDISRCRLFGTQISTASMSSRSMRWQCLRI